MLNKHDCYIFVHVYFNEFLKSQFWSAIWRSSEFSESISEIYLMTQLRVICRMITLSKSSTITIFLVLSSVEEWSLF